MLSHHLDLDIDVDSGGLHLRDLESFRFYKASEAKARKLTALHSTPLHSTRLPIGGSRCFTQLRSLRLREVLEKTLTSSRSRYPLRTLPCPLTALFLKDQRRKGGGRGENGRKKQHNPHIHAQYIALYPSLIADFQTSLVQIQRHKVTCTQSFVRRKAQA